MSAPRMCPCGRPTVTPYHQHYAVCIRALPSRDALPRCPFKPTGKSPGRPWVFLDLVSTQSSNVPFEQS